MQIDEVRRVLVVGAGTMGQEIGLQCAVHGYEVTLYDTSQDALEGARKQHEEILADFVAQDLLTEALEEATLARITATTDPAAAAAEADLLSESLPERLELKREVLARFHALCPPHTVFTTNTSTLVPSMLADASGRPAQFAALHFHHVVWVSNVADVMPHPETAPETITLLEAFARRIGQIPIVLRKENPGYLLNAMLVKLLGAALTLVADEVAPIQDVDRAWMGVMKMPIGPLGIIDSIGLDTVYDVTSHWADTLKDPEMQKNAELLQSYVAQGRLGKKAGEGFYRYPDPLYQQPDFLTSNATEEP